MSYFVSVRPRLMRDNLNWWILLERLNDFPNDKLVPGQKAVGQLRC
jgi:hypothetical protein